MPSSKARAAPRPVSPSASGLVFPATPQEGSTHVSKVSYTSPGRDFFRRDEKGQQIATREASMRESL